jgi:hypothetical protein
MEKALAIADSTSRRDAYRRVAVALGTGAGVEYLEYLLELGAQRQKEQEREKVAAHPTDHSPTPASSISLPVQELAREICPDGSFYVGTFTGTLERHTVLHPSLASKMGQGTGAYSDQAHALKFLPLGSARLTLASGDVLDSHFRNGSVYGRATMEYNCSRNVYDGHFLEREKRLYRKADALVPHTGFTGEGAGTGSSSAVAVEKLDTSSLSQEAHSHSHSRTGTGTGTSTGAGASASRVAIDADEGTVKATVTLKDSPFRAVEVLRHGEGKYTYAETGDVYIGQFALDMKEGTGVYISHTGSTYKGEHVKDQFHGDGTFKWADGGEYSGQWAEGMKHGPYGRMSHASGHVYECAWYRDKRHGPGRHVSASGDVFVGTFVNDLKHGEGEIHHASTGTFLGEHIYVCIYIYTLQLCVCLCFSSACIPCSPSHPLTHTLTHSHTHTLTHLLQANMSEPSTKRERRRASCTLHSQVAVDTSAGNNWMRCTNRQCWSTKSDMHKSGMNICGSKL